MNLGITYLYRDAGNFKSFGSVIVANLEALTAMEVEMQLRESLMDRTYFIAESVSLPALCFSPRIEKLDHSWHELESVKEMTSAPTDEICRTGADMIACFRRATGEYGGRRSSQTASRRSRGI